MKGHVEYFKIHLGSKQSIGPRALRALWSQASMSEDISVSMQSRQTSLGSREVYTLSGTPRLIDQPTIEVRLRKLLLDANLIGSITAVHQ
jgi:hypothetical protein